MASTAREQGPFERCSDAYRSVSSVGWFAFVLLVLEAIALPGMKGGPGTNMLLVVAGTFFYGFFGVLLGGLGQRACRAPVVDGRATWLRGLSWVALVLLTVSAIGWVWLTYTPWTASHATL